MRTTLDIDDDVLEAAKERARRDRTTAGAVISALARQALNAGYGPLSAGEPEVFYGFRPIASRGNIVTDDHIDKLRDDDAY